MAAATFPKMLIAQVERAKESRKVVVQFAAEIPGDGSQVSVDWWLRQINTALSSGDVPVAMEFADLDKPAAIVTDGESSAIMVTQLKRQLAEARAYIADLETHLNEKAMQLADEMSGKMSSVLSAEEEALRAVELHGVYVDAKGARWVDIATEARRIGVNYINLWRAAKNATSGRISSWVVGSTNAGGDRILVKQGSYMQARKGK